MPNSLPGAITADHLARPAADRPQRADEAAAPGHDEVPGPGPGTGQWMTEKLRHGRVPGAVTFEVVVGT